MSASGLAPPRHGSATGRQGFLDVVRAVAISRVVVWHAYGAPALSYLVASMPAMFFVAGHLLAGSLDRKGYRAVLVERLTRVLLPLWAFGAFAFTLMGLAHVRSTGPATAIDWWRPLFWIVPVSDPTGTGWEAGWLSSPLWYLRAYLWLLVLSPLLLAAVRRRAGLALGLAALSVLAVEAIERSGRMLPGWELLRWKLGDLALYSVFLMLGFIHHDGGLARLARQQRVQLAVVAFASAALWITTQPVHGWVVNNSYPAHLAIGAGWLFLALAFERRVATIADLPVIGAVIRWLNARALTIYLWHTTAIVVAYWLAARFGVLSGPFGVGLLVPIVAVTFVLVLAFGWVEDVAARRPPRVWPVGPRRPIAGRHEGIARLAAMAPVSMRQFSLGLAAGLVFTMITVGVVLPSGGAERGPAVEAAGGLALPPTPSGRPDLGDDPAVGSVEAAGGLALPPTPSGRPDLGDGADASAVAGSSVPPAAPMPVAPAPVAPVPVAPVPIAPVPGVADHRAEAIAGVVEAWRIEHAVDGVAIVVDAPEGQVLSAGFGIDPSTGLAMSADLVMPVTSLTKSFAAALVLQLVEEGLLDLDAPLPELQQVPGFAYAGMVTPRQLLDHTSGLAPYQQAPGYDPAAGLTAAEAVAMSGRTPLDWEPGAESGYSNSGFLVAGLLVEQLTGRSFDELIIERFAVPLGLGSTRLDTVPRAGWIGHAAGGLESSAADLARWGVALFRDRTVLGEAALAEMTDVSNPWSVGLGAFPVCPCEVADDGTRTVTSIGHNAGSGTLQFSPADGLVISVLLTEPIFGGALTQQDLYFLLREIRGLLRDQGGS